MKIISWNCRGVGSPHTVPRLKYIVRVYKPDILYLCETITTSNKTEELRYALGFDFCLLLTDKVVVEVLCYFGNLQLIVPLQVTQIII